MITASFDGSGGCNINSTGASFQNQTDGSGNQSVSVGSNSDTTTGCTYTVTAEGAFTLNMESSKGTEVVSGWVSAYGNTLVVGGTGGTGYEVDLTIGTRLW